MVDSISHLLEAISKIAWPAIFLGLFVWLGPEIKAFVKNMQDAKLSVGDISISASARAATDVAKAELARNPAVTNSDPNSAASVFANSFLAASQTINSTLTQGNSFKGSRILWVDDHPSNNTFLQNAMQNLGASVTDALSTDEALAKAGNQAFDLIISDMGRPESDHAGFDLLQKLRSRAINTPFIIYSSRGDDKAVQESKAAGAFGATNSPNELMRLAGQALSSTSVRWTRQ
jgi:CheY-like chemotaxis protein